MVLKSCLWCVTESDGILSSYARTHDIKEGSLAGRARFLARKTAAFPTSSSETEVGIKCSKDPWLQPWLNPYESAGMSQGPQSLRGAEQNKGLFLHPRHTPPICTAGWTKQIPLLDGSPAKEQYLELLPTPGEALEVVEGTRGGQVEWNHLLLQVFVSQPQVEKGSDDLTKQTEPALSAEDLFPYCGSQQMS